MDWLGADLSCVRQVRQKLPDFWHEKTEEMQALPLKGWQDAALARIN